MVLLLSFERHCGVERTTMHLLRMPTELLLEIARSIDNHADIRRLLRSHSRLYAVLYRLVATQAFFRLALLDRSCASESCSILNAEGCGPAS